MKRPGIILKPETESSVPDDEIHTQGMTKEAIIYKYIKDFGPLTMEKIAVLAGIKPRTVRDHLRALVVHKLVEKTECPHCGSPTTYKIK